MHREHYAQNNYKKPTKKSTKPAKLLKSLKEMEQEPFAIFSLLNITWKAQYTFQLSTQT